MRVVEEAIEDRIPEGGIANDLVPVIGRDLTGEQGASAAVAVIEHLEKVVASRVVQGRQPPVVQDQKVSPGEALEEAGPRPVPPSDQELVEKPGQAVVADAQPMATGLMAEGAGEVGLARSRGSDEEHALTPADPLAVAEPKDEGSVQAPGLAEVQVFQGGVQVQSGLSQQSLEPTVGPVGLLPLEQERETVLEGELVDVTHLQLFLERGPHTGKPELVKELEGGVLKHDQSPWEDPLGL
jgi:hypothetical protein